MLVVIPCAASKLDRVAPTRELYDSDHFRFTLRAAEAHARQLNSRVMILSAKHGLLDLDTVIEPYDLAMGQPGAVDAVKLAAQLSQLGAHTIEALLPSRYLTILRRAVDLLDGQADLVDLYDAAPGIGYQRALLSSLLRQAVPGI